MPIIETDKLSKEYSNRFSKQKVNALNDFTFTVNEGEIFGLLGPNGAGKTTLIKMLLSITFPTRGSAKVFGMDVSNHKWKNKVGYLPENHKYPNYLTGDQVLSYYGRLSGLKSGAAFQKKLSTMFELMNLKQWNKTKIKKYSKGMMQKLGLAQAILNEPDLIFLDEPTDGVDPIGRKEIREILLGLKEKGKTIFLNSHLLSEVEMICDRVAILNKGDLIKEGSVEDLTKAENIYVIETVEQINLDLKQKIIAFDANAGIGEKEINSVLNQDITGLKDNLAQSKERMVQIEADFLASQKTVENLNSEFSLVKAENTALRDQVQGLQLDISQAKAEREQMQQRLSSIAELKKAIKELRQKTRLAKRQVQNRVDMKEKMVSGNEGFLIKNGKSIFSGIIKIKVEPLPGS